MNKLLLIFFFFLLSFNSNADVVKPALVEVSIYPNNHFEVKMRLSLEAIITEIGSQYKNTQNAPNAKSYDELRVLESKELEDKFTKYEKKFLQNITLKFDNKNSKLTRSELYIPIVGYKKIPRMSRITYTGILQQRPKELLWQYAKVYGDNAIRYRFVKEGIYTWQAWKWLKNGDAQQITFAKPIKGIWQSIIEFAWIGYQHILPKGLDHILFIIGIALFSIRWQILLTMVTAFTIAHTTTLALSMYQIISLPVNIVEPLIAISIIYVGVENLYSKHYKKLRILVVFTFGLIHGLGFASVLSDFNMQKENFLTMLLSFNLGVELGQISIIAVILLLRYLLNYYKIDTDKYMVKPIAIMISVIAFVWTIERVFYV